MLQQPDQRSARDPQQVRRLLGKQRQVVRGDCHGQAGLHSRCDLEEYFEYRLRDLDAAPVRAR